MISLQTMSGNGQEKQPEEDFPTRVEEHPKLGRFQVQKLLGQGGFAQVYLAYDPLLERQVAIKVPHADFKQIDLLRREARMAAKLKHPAIVQIYEISPDSSTDPTSRDSPVYLVMQYIEGTSLAKRLEVEKVSRDEAVDLLLDVADAVGYAHGAGVLHRDLKPHNILLDANNHPYVADFGLAVRQETLAHHVGEAWGTPAYMAPEQADGLSLTPASDIWSLGVILYEMLVQQRPFGSHPLEVLRRLGKEDPVRPTELDSTVPQDLERICLRCLSRNPADRYKSMHDLIADLRKWKTHRAAGPSEADLHHAERYYKQAFSDIDAGDLARATDRLQNVVQLNPDFANAYYLLGLCHLMSDQQVQSALVALERATELNRDNGAAHFLLANVYYELKIFHLAALHADQALATKPTDHTYRDFQKKVRQKASAVPSAEALKTPEIDYELEPARRRQLSEVAESVFHLEKTRQLTLRHWAELHYPWRAIRHFPLTGSLFIAAGLYAACVTIQLLDWEARRVVQFGVAYVIIWMGLYLPFVIARMLESTYVRLLPVVNMPEDAFRRFFIRQVGHILGNTCTTKETGREAARLSWQHNRAQLLIALGALPPLLLLQYICANEPPWPITLPKVALYFSATLEIYVLMWIFPLAVSSLLFIPRFSNIPLRYFLDMPDALSLSSVGKFYIRLSWLACLGYFFFLLEHYVFRTYQTVVFVSDAYVVVGICWAVAIVLISQHQLHRLLKNLKTRKMVEYSYHLEDAFERVMKNPNDKAFEQLRAHQQFSNSLRRLSTRALTRADIVHFLLIVALLLGITLGYAYLVFHQVWWV